ncbi:hypothetical protein GCM10019017_00550 [Streptomyces showdoensis]
MVRRAAGLGPFAQGVEIQDELLQAQIEVATPVCSSLDEVGGHLLRLRHAGGLGRGGERLPGRRDRCGAAARGGRVSP